MFSRVFTPLFARVLLLALAGLGARSSIAQLPGQIDLSEPAGTEPADLLRIYGSHADEKLSVTRFYGAAFGDIDNDGFADLLLGSEGDAPGGSRAGRVYVVYGGTYLRNFPSRTLSLATTDPVTSAGETRVLGDDVGDEFGAAVASGDVNGDGFEDIVLGALSINAAASANRGGAIVIYGGTGKPGAPALTGSTIDLNSNGAISAFGETRIVADDGADLMGGRIAVGDLDGDGFDEVIVTSVAASGGAGEAIVIWGSAALPGTKVDLDTNGAISFAGETRILGEAGNDVLGASVGVGDLNGDGILDLFIGAGKADPPGRIDSGIVYVLYGPVPRATILDMDPPPGETIAAGETRIYAAAANDELGRFVASGDINADGYDELIMTASLADPFSKSSAGEVYVLYGQPVKFGTAVDDGTVLDLSGAVGSFGETRLFGAAPSDQAGLPTRSGDVNGDGYGDLIVSARQTDPNGRTNAGQIYLVYGGATKPGTPVGTGSASNLESIANVVVLGESNFGFFGEAAAAGADLDGDGFGDFAGGGSELDNPNGPLNNSGGAVAIFGSGFVESGTARQRTRTGDGAGGGKVPFSYFGPTARAWIDFADDDLASASGGGASTETVTVTRSDASIQGLGDGSLADVANVLWQVTTDRANWSGARATFKYADGEIAGLDENELKLFRAPTITGPWEVVEDLAVDAGRNRIGGTVDSFSYFAISLEPRAAVKRWTRYE